MLFNDFLGQQRKAADHHKFAVLRSTEDGEILCMQKLSAWQEKRLS
jgi:hypothetical protein